MGNIIFKGDDTYWGMDLNFNLYSDFETAVTNWRTQQGAIVNGEMENGAPAQSLSQGGWMVLWGTPQGQMQVFMILTYSPDQNISFNAQGAQPYAEVYQS